MHWLQCQCISFVIREKVKYILSVCAGLSGKDVQKELYDYCQATLRNND